MTERERLIELICTGIKKHHSNDRQYLHDSIANVLLENGVIVPPCKVGDTVYVKNRANKPQEMIFDSVDLRCTCVRDDDCMCGSLCGDIDHSICQYRFKNDFSDFGKTVFLTKEEAEQALKESSQL